MSFAVVLSMEAVEDVLQITLASQAKRRVIVASQQIQDSLGEDPASAGFLLSEGLYYIDCEPLRAFYSIDAERRVVDIVNVRRL